MNEIKRYIPARIRQARVSRGMSTTELADNIGVTRASISRYEVGTLDPGESTMRNIVDALNYPIDFFKKTMPEIHADFSESPVYYRKQKGASVKLKNAAEVRVEQFSEVDMFFRQYIDFPEVDILRSSLNICKDNLKYIDPEKIADDLRNHWQIGDGPILNLCRLLEKKGFLISTMQNGFTKIYAFSQWYKNGIPYIFYGSDTQSAVKYRFDLAHELGHLIMHSHISEEEMENKETYELMDDEADAFAGAFLMPASSFSSEIYSSSIDHLLMLKKKWKVSVAAMIYRIQELNLLSNSQVNYLKDQMKIRRYWHREPYDDEMIMEKPIAHKQAFNILIENKLLTVNDFLNNNPYYPVELETMCFLDNGCLQGTISDMEKVISLKDYSSNKMG